MEKRYKVYHSAKFDKDLKDKDKTFLDRIEKIEDQLVNNPYLGDNIDINWFREKRFGKYRIYFLIYDHLEAVLMVAISEKNDQQKIINTIRFLLNSFKDELLKLIDKEKLT